MDSSRLRFSFSDTFRCIYRKECHEEESTTKRTWSTRRSAVDHRIRTGLPASFDMLSPQSKRANLLKSASSVKLCTAPMQRVRDCKTMDDRSHLLRLQYGFHFVSRLSCKTIVIDLTNQQMAVQMRKSAVHVPPIDIITVPRATKIARPVSMGWKPARARFAS